MKTNITVTAVALFVLVPAVAGAQGMLIPKDTSMDPLNIESHRVTVDVVDGVAKTTVDQVFRNDCGSDLEATYIFPLPPGATWYEATGAGIASSARVAPLPVTVTPSRGWPSGSSKLTRTS